MSNIFKNDETEYIQTVITETTETITGLHNEIDSCQDCIDEAKEELERRGTKL